MDASAESTAGRRLADIAATVAILAFAFAWCWVCGNRGLFPLDQSIVLDGAWRRLELDRVPLWRGDHVALRQVAEDFARYLDDAITRAVDTPRSGVS